MQTIEINTTQNVKIEYELAGLGQRIFAYAIDLIVMILVFILIMAGIFSSPEESDDPGSGVFTIQVLAFFWFGFYTLVSELIGNGQTIGKRAMGIKVIKINGDEPEFYDYFSRWSMRMVDIYFSVGSIAILLIASNKNGQRLGDIIAGTSVIRKRSSYGFQLADILKLNEKNREEYRFQYPNAAKLEEKDVLLIKNLLHRKHRYDNSAHDEAMHDLVARLVEILELDDIPKAKEAFLNKVISEYIILTR